MQWIIHSKNLTLNTSSIFQFKYSIGNYELLIDEIPLNTMVSSTYQKGLFIFGYILPRLDFKLKTDLNETILEGLEQYGPEFINNFKGNFTIVAFYDNKLSILNDQFGVNKYFYSGDKSNFIASNTLTNVKNNRDIEISKKNILKYYVFNYFIDGLTIYTDVFYSTGATCKILDKQITTIKYFDIQKFIDDKELVLSKKNAIKESTLLWKTLIKQYLTFFKDRRISQTLTAGMDSRLILAGFRANGYTPSTFTFGHSNNVDVVHAKKVSQKLAIEHDHLFPPQEFFSEFGKYAENVIKKTSGIGTIFRSHRLHAYEAMKSNYDVLFFGFLGSEVIRGLYPDRLLVPGVCIDYWLNGKINIKDYYPENWFDFSEKELQEVTEEVYSNSILHRPDLLLFNLMIPLHFSQDISLNEDIGILSVAPFWDIDFVDFLSRTPFFVDNRKKRDFAKLGHFSRSKGPYFSSKLITALDRKNAKMSLGKGYSPSDYSISRYYAGLKFIVFKTFLRKRYQNPNFDYTDWFKVFLKDYIDQNACTLPFIKVEKEVLKAAIDSVSESHELAFLPIVKLINVEMIRKTL